MWCVVKEGACCGGYFEPIRSWAKPASGHSFYCPEAFRSTLFSASLPFPFGCVLLQPSTLPSHPHSTAMKIKSHLHPRSSLTHPSFLPSCCSCWCRHDWCLWWSIRVQEDLLLILRRFVALKMFFSLAAPRNAREYFKTIIHRCVCWWWLCLPGWMAGWSGMAGHMARIKKRTWKVFCCEQCSQNGHAVGGGKNSRVEWTKI